MREQTTAKTRTTDIQETLKILQFRFGRTVDYRPVVRFGGIRYYLVEGKLQAESVILRWVEAGRS
jgi:hypothetical protein